MLESGGYCGIDCNACPALLATRKGDEAALAAVAAEWSKLYGAQIPPESIPCAGCFARAPAARRHPRAATPTSASSGPAR